MFIRESSNCSATSSDAELDDLQRNKLDYVKQMTTSDNIVDNRLINVYKIRKMHEKGKLVGIDTEESQACSEGVFEKQKGAKFFFTKLFKGENSDNNLSRQHSMKFRRQGSMVFNKRSSSLRAQKSKFDKSIMGMLDREDDSMIFSS